MPARSSPPASSCWRRRSPPPSFRSRPARRPGSSRSATGSPRSTPRTPRSSRSRNPTRCPATWPPAREPPGSSATGRTRSPASTPRRRRSRGRSRRPARRAQLAAGEGALWVGNGGGRFVTTTVSISRVDPRSNRVTRTLKLPGATGDNLTASPNTGFAQIAVGAGAVWARNPDDTISRIDPDTGRLVDTIDVAASTIAAGREGVWFVPWDRPSVKRIDPRTNRVVQTIPIGAELVARHRGGRRVRLGDSGERGPRVADRAGRAAGHEDDRRGRGGELHRLRRGRGLDCQLHGRHGLPDRSAHQRRDGQDRRRGAAGACGRRGIGLGERGGRAGGGRASRFRLWRGGIGRPETGRPDRVRPSASGTRERRAACDGRCDPVRGRAAWLQGGQALGRLCVV